jgi:biotin carboxyl carrier protein
VSKLELETPVGPRAVDVRIEGSRVVALGRELELVPAPPGEVVLRDRSGRTTRAIVRRDGDAFLVWHEGRAWRLPLAKSGKRAAAAHDAALEAPMPGTCRAVLVSPGQRVEKGQRLVIVEAMKMEHELKAPRAGVVAAIHCAPGQPVAPGTPLVELGE